MYADNLTGTAIGGRIGQAIGKGVILAGRNPPLVQPDQRCARASRRFKSPRQPREVSTARLGIAGRQSGFWPEALILGIALATTAFGQRSEVDKFRETIVRRHNQLRARHGATALKLDEALNAYAQNWANQLAASRTFRHSGGNYGENLYYASSSSGIDAAAAAEDATESWYGESARYRYGSGFSSATGHFTQLVWRGSVRLGCGMARVSSEAMNTVYVVCSYDPPGNVTSEFRQNVLPPR